MVASSEQVWAFKISAIALVLVTVSLTIVSDRLAHVNLLQLNALGISAQFAAKNDIVQLIQALPLEGAQDYYRQAAYECLNAENFNGKLTLEDLKSNEQILNKVTTFRKYIEVCRENPLPRIGIFLKNNEQAIAMLQFWQSFLFMWLVILLVANTVLALAIQGFLFYSKENLKSHLK